MGVKELIDSLEKNRRGRPTQTNDIPALKHMIISPEIREGLKIEIDCHDVSISPLVDHGQDLEKSRSNKVEKQIILNRQRVIQGLKERFGEETCQNSNQCDIENDGGEVIDDKVSYDEHQEQIWSDDIEISINSPLKSLNEGEERALIGRKSFENNFSINSSTVSAEEVEDTVNESNLDSPLRLSLYEIGNEAEFTLDSSFRVSFEAIDRLSTPLPTRYGDKDDDFSSLVKYCQNAPTLQSPDRDELRNVKKLFSNLKTRLICSSVIPVVYRRKRGCHYAEEGLTLLGKSIAIAYVQLKYLQRDSLIALASMLLNMVAALYPTVPRSSFAINCFCLLNYFAERRQEISFYYHLLHLVLGLFASMIDISWLLFPYIPFPIKPQADIITYNMAQERLPIRSCCWYSLTFSTILTVFTTVFAIYSRSDGQQFLSAMWSKIRLFLPIPPFNKYSLQSRAIAVIWLHAISFCFFLSIALTAQFQFDWTPQFSTPFPFLTFRTISCIKAGSCFAFVIGMLFKSDIFAIIAAFGCTGPCQERCQRRRNRMYNERGFHIPAIMITPCFLSIIGFLKAIDEVAGIFMCASLVHAHSFGDPIKQVELIIGISFVILSICDIVGFCLVGIFIYYSRLTFQYDHNVSDEEEEANESNESYAYDQERLTYNKERRISRHVIKTSTDFLVAWRSLSCKMISKSRITAGRLSYSRENIMAFIEKRGFIVVASGTLDSSEIKIFSFKPKDGINGLIFIKCNIDGIRIEIRCTEKKMLKVFYDALSPEDLFSTTFTCEYKKCS